VRTRERYGQVSNNHTFVDGGGRLWARSLAAALSPMTPLGIISVGYKQAGFQAAYTGV